MITSIFLPLEGKEFEASSEQCFLLGYRATAMEFSKKKASSNLSDFNKSLDRGRNQDDQYMIQERMLEFSAGVKAGLRDLKILKGEYDDILLTKDFRKTRHVVIHLSEPPDVMSTGAIYPEYDFHGNKLQDLMDIQNTLSHLTLASFATSNGGP